jgi:hypothetical protein
MLATALPGPASCGGLDLQQAQLLGHWSPGVVVPSQSVVRQGGPLGVLRRGQMGTGAVAILGVGIEGGQQGVGTRVHQTGAGPQQLCLGCRGQPRGILAAIEDPLEPSEEVCNTLQSTFHPEPLPLAQTTSALGHHHQGAPCQVLKAFAIGVSRRTQRRCTERVPNLLAASWNAGCHLQLRQAVSNGRSCCQGTAL